jgi:transposase
MNKENQETTPQEIEQLIERVEKGQIEEKDKKLISKLLRLVLTLIQVMQAKNSTISKLKRLIFGSKAEKTQEDGKSEKESESRVINANANANDADSSSKEAKEETKGKEIEQKEINTKKKRKGHGRIKAADYIGAKTIYCENKEIAAGQKCPDEQCRGKLYDTKKPQEFIRLEGSPLVMATKYEQEVLKCSCCQSRYVASLPRGVVAEKWSETADAAIAYAKYAMGMPFYRIAKGQKDNGVPLPASTQFERCEEVAKVLNPVYVELKRILAQSSVLYGDDTRVKILELIKENQNPKIERKGMQSTAIASQKEHYIAIYISGRKYSGENLQELLKIRTNKQEPIIMGDGSSKNWVGEYKKIIAKCLVHARRQFVEIEKNFPQSAKYVIEMLAKIYKIESQTVKMNQVERLLYHQQHSEPIMKELKQWCDEEIEKEEESSGLGKALSYMKKHWEELSRFLTVAGAPLDNNYVERILKRVVLNRKNSLFYKTEHGAAIGDIIMSVIETCSLNKVNVFQYMVSLLQNPNAVRAKASQYLPWNYKNKLAQVA